MPKKPFSISITEYPNINKIYFNKNERLKDEELLTYSQQLNLINLNPISINNYIDEIKNIYSTFGYNNIQINYSENIFENTNTADLYFEINQKFLLFSSLLKSIFKISE